MSEKKPSRLNSMAWYLQLLLFGGVAIVLFGIFWYFVTKPIRAETYKVYNSRLVAPAAVPATPAPPADGSAPAPVVAPADDLTGFDGIIALKQKNEAARIASQRINEFRAAYASKMEEYDELKALLPEQREITNVLQNLQDRARASRLVLRRFSPKDDVQQDFVSGKPVEVEVTSTFANLRDFYEGLARLQRIVSVTDFSINQAPVQTANKTIEARFVLTAYYASPENLEAKPATPAPAPGQPAAPGQLVAPSAQPAAPPPGSKSADKY